MISNCDGYWEHDYGVKIYTADNPGWIVQIDLSGTSLEDTKDYLKEDDQGDDDWYFLKVTDNIFLGSGDLNKLEIILNGFKEFVESRTVEK